VLMPIERAGVGSEQISSRSRRSTKSSPTTSADINNVC